MMLAVSTAGLAQTCASVTLSSYSYIAPIAGTSVNRIITVNVLGNCLRPATTTDSWISITSGWEPDSRGIGSFQFSVAQNLTGPARIGHIYIAGATFTVTQDGILCTYALQPNPAPNVPVNGGTGSIAVNPNFSTCPWNAVANQTYLTISGGSTGTGRGTVSYKVDSNLANSARNATIVISMAGISTPSVYTIHQLGDSACSFTVSPASKTVLNQATTDTFTVTSTLNTCTRTAVSDVPWLIVTSGASGTGTGTIGYSVQTNTATAARTGHIAVMDATFSVIQTANLCDIFFNPPNTNVAAGTSSGKIGVNSACSWTAASNASWISITSGATSISGQGTISYSVNANLTGASRVGTIQIGSQTFTITQAGPVPVVFANGVVNAASFKAGAVAPGEIITIYGAFIGSSTLATMQLNEAGTSITNLLGATRVLFDGVPSPIIYSSATQTSAIVPYSVTGKTSTNMTVEYQGATSNAIVLNVASASPAIFALDSSGAGPGAVLNQDSSLNSAANPAARDTIIQIFATGEGVTDPAGIDGKLASVPLPAPVNTVSVSIGGVDAPVVYSGGAPGLVAGLFQVNVRVPQNAPVGAAVPIVVRAGKIDSPAGITIAVQ